jgi:hypothetical protein
VKHALFSVRSVCARTRSRQNLVGTMTCGELGAMALLLERHNADITVRDRIVLISRVKAQ